ncbi:alpha/beta hydrolase family protein [Bradyrhizobium sp. DASA03005]|uniref:alpha/beta hydrolase family protein n=1 Tax=Bradyrhizobium sp. SPXBL-02 TaxID=3395912 RepID=UPI003F7049AD
MLRAAWPELTGNLTSTRQSAVVFLDGVDQESDIASRRNCAAKWTSIGDAHCLFANLSVQRGAHDEAAHAWLCALTAFEVARRLSDEDDPQRVDVVAKLEASVEGFGSLDQRVERVQITLYDHGELSAYYVPAGTSTSCVPAIVCISREEETAGILLGRLLPLITGRNMAVLVVSYDDVSSHWVGPSDILLSCCLDHLSTLPEIDASRMAIYGEGLSAALATNFAATDRRVSAAICDGGLWSWTRTRSSIEWMTRTAEPPGAGLSTTQRSRLARKLRCPILVVAGERSVFNASEAIKLEADCAWASIDLDLLMPQTAEGAFENFITCDEAVFEWLERKLDRAPAS